MNMKRQPAGIPVGGQFAANEHDEAEGSLAPGGTADVYTPRGFISIEEIINLERAFDRERAGDATAQAEIDRILDSNSDGGDLAMEVSMEYDDAATHESFAWEEFRENTKSLVYAHRGWNEDEYPEPQACSRADEAKGKPVAEINKMLRQEIKAAQSSGYISDGIKVSVQKSPAGYPRVTVAGVPHEFMYHPSRPGDPAHASEYSRRTPEFRELDERIRKATSVFGTPRTDPHSDYDNSYNIPVVVYDRP